MRLAAVDPTAARAGLAPGMALADARARLPALRAEPHDPAGDAAWLKALGDGAMRYTPLLALDPPDGLILDITGAAHPYGGEQGLLRDVLARLTPIHPDVRLALAGHAAAARALARHARAATPGAREDGRGDWHAAVRRLPVAALELDAEATRALQRAGLSRVGDLAMRPMAALAARFGAPAVLALARLLGEADGPIRPHAVMPPVWILKRLAEPVLVHAQAMAIVARLADRALRHLAERGEGGRRFVAHFFRTDGRAAMLGVETGQPLGAGDAAVLMRLFAERMAALDDPMDPGFGYDAVGLHVPTAEPLAPAQPGLGESGQAGETLAMLVDRLGARLGPAAIRRLAPADSHVPEQAELALPAADAPASRYLPAKKAPAGQWQPAGDPDGVPMRPILLIDPPQPVDVLAEVPDGPPRRFRWKGRLHQVRLAEGPERIAAEWWRRRHGHLPGRGLPTRDYYRVEDMAGRRFWLFRHGLYEERAAPRWYIHGLFA